LTVTYYVEPQNLRTITIPVHRANVLILGLGGAVLWTLGSGVFLGSRLFSQERPVPAVAALNDAVVTKKAEPPAVVAKPVDKELAAVAKKAADAKKAAEKAAAVAKAEALVAKIEAEKHAVLKPQEPFGPPRELADPDAAVPAPVVAEAAAAAEPLSSRLEVKDAAFAYKADEGVFNLDFKIQNKGKPEAKGKVWGVATYTTKSGKHLEIASADGVNFKAKALTLKALQFPLPQSEPGFIAEVTIHVSEEAATDEMTSTYKLDESGKTNL
jgi:hypothetical protein